LFYNKILLYLNYIIGDQVLELSREEIEKDMNFVGFLVMEN
jgi:hypothetical protein